MKYYLRLILSPLCLDVFQVTISSAASCWEGQTTKPCRHSSWCVPAARRRCGSICQQRLETLDSITVLLFLLQFECHGDEQKSSPDSRPVSVQFIDFHEQWTANSFWTDWLQVFSGVCSDPTQDPTFSYHGTYVCHISFLANQTDSRKHLGRHTCRRSYTWAHKHLQREMKKLEATVSPHSKIKKRERLKRWLKKRAKDDEDKGHCDGKVRQRWRE